MANHLAGREIVDDYPISPTSREATAMSLEMPPMNPDDPRYTKRGALYVPAGAGPTIWAVSDVYTIKAIARPPRRPGCAPQERPDDAMGWY